jgi:hypothetical protein
MWGVPLMYLIPLLPIAASYMLLGKKGEDIRQRFFTRKQEVSA